MNSEQISSVHIDSGLNLIVEGIEASAKPLFSKSFKAVNEAHSFSENNLPWFDDECRIKRNDFYRFLNIFRNDRSDQNRLNMVSARSAFKKSLRVARYRYDT